MRFVPYVNKGSDSQITSSTRRPACLTGSLAICVMQIIMFVHGKQSIEIPSSCALDNKDLIKHCILSIV
jgi:hypothetical protein